MSEHEQFFAMSTFFYSRYCDFLQSEQGEHEKRLPLHFTENNKIPGAAPAYTLDLVFSYFLFYQT